MNQLPQSDPPRPSPDLLRRIDEIADRFEAAWADVTPPNIHDFLEPTADEEQQALLAELSGLDRQWRAKLSAERGIASSAAAGAESDATIPGYEVIGEIGRGGMGVVYQARQIGLNRVVALKVVLSGVHAGEEELSRFRAEAETVARLDHAHIVQIHEVGELRGRPFLALEFVDGQTLADKLAHRPQLPIYGAELTEKLARAIHVAHRRGIIHRDLKPANILLTQDGTPKISDFGLARQIDRDSQATATGTILGTASYMAPEQAKGQSRLAGPAADVYSLGAILYEMLTGQPPFTGATPIETIEQVCFKEPVAPRRLQPKIPADLETICLKCLRKEAVQRYASAQDLADDLRRFLDGQPIIARPVSLGERALKWIRRNPGRTAAIAVAVAAVIGAAVAETAHQHQLVETRMGTHAAALVDELVSADVADVPGIVDKLSGYHRWADSLLADRLTRAPRDSKEWLRVALASLPADQSLTESLAERLLTARPEEVLVLRKSLISRQPPVAAKYWRELENQQGDIHRRLRAACALALLDASSTRWRPAFFQDLADQLVTENPLTLEKWSECLRPIRARLIEPLLKDFRKAELPEASRFVVTTLLVEYAHDRPDVLAKLAAEADAKQFQVVFPALQSCRSQAIAVFLDLLRQSPAADDESARIQCGRVKAKTALALIRLHEPTPACSVFHFDRDPEALSQFVVRAKDFGLTPAELCDCLTQSAPDDTFVRYGLLLALGCFEWSEIPETLRPLLLSRLQDWHARDRRSCIHGACEWLLTKWELAISATAEGDGPLPPEFPLPDEREWFALRIADTPLNFVVFPPQAAVLGSPLNENLRAINEERHQVKLARPFAIMAQEVTMQWWYQFLQETNRDRAEWENRDKRNVKFRDLDYPANYVQWDEAVEFCRWLTQKAGLPDTDQCYEEFTLPGAQPDGKQQREWKFFPQRKGFRLPTEAEWETACRCGAQTTYGFGSDPSLLPYFGVFLETSKQQPQPGRSRRPNLRGLFDMHGNVWEWCHDKKRNYAADLDNEVIDPLGSDTERTHAYRGGSYDNYARHGRSACRIFDQPGYSYAFVGFRVACTLAEVQDE